MMLKAKILAMLCLGVLCSTTMGAILADDFDVENNPDGVWTYGYLDNGNFVTYAYRNNADSINVKNWCGNHNGAANPDVQGNINKAFGSASDQWGWGPGMSWEPGMICVMTANSGGGAWVTTVRFTAPTAGQWSVAIDFENRVMNGAATNVFVNRDGGSVFTDTISGFLGSSLGAPAVAGNPTTGYAATLTLNAGDTIDFGVSGAGLHQVAVGAEIAAVPEPMTMALLAVGGVAAVIRRRMA